ncbi:MAG: FadR/GntR family transcriptional regulator [Canibacter sp.]
MPNDVARTASAAHASSRLRNAAFAPIGEEGRAELVATRLIQTITSGAYVQGEKLPSEQELSELLGVAIITIRDALSNLRMRGYIATKRGRNGGSFVRASHAEIIQLNSRSLAAMPRIELADLGVHYEVISIACAEYACRRATPDELAAVLDVLESLRDLPAGAWRRQITDVQLELAALSQSVRLTNEHIRVHTECIPLLSLQDGDEEKREETHNSLVEKAHAIQAGDEHQAREIVKQDVRASIRWLVAYRAQLLEDEKFQTNTPTSGQLPGHISAHLSA